ncbi:MAG: class I SAM-dependent methyltransferase [Chloroflexota bacterium]
MSKIYGYLKGMHAAHLIDLGVRLGLFESLVRAGGAANPSELAITAQLHEEYVAIWCETACALELLDRDVDGRFHFAAHMDVILGEPGSNYYLGGFPAAHFQFTRDYSRYPELFRSGAVVSYQEHDEPFFRAVAGATKTLPRMFMDSVLPKLPSLAARLESGARVLDLGCGGGYAIVEFATRYPATTCVGVDVEGNSVAMAQAHIRDRNVSNRVEARVVDGAELPTDLIGGFDLVTQFLVLHEVHPSIKATVIHQCAAALKSGGQLMLFDEAYPSGAGDLRHPLQIHAVMAQWYESTWGNTINTREEIRTLLGAAGLTVVDETELSRFYIVVAQKA